MNWFPAPFPPRRVALALAALFCAAPLHAQMAQLPVAAPAPPAPAPAAAPAADDKVLVRAEEVTGQADRQVNLDRNVEIIEAATRMTADSACYKIPEDEVTARGNINMWRNGDRFKGDELQLNLSSGKGWLLHPEYKMKLNNAQGNANRIDFLSEDEALVSRGTYSTCDGPNPDWYLTSSTLRLDQGRDVGVAGKTVIYFKGVPIMGTPAMSFSLSGARRSGWLPPSVGFSPTGSAEAMVPYYVNIAPNRDLTLYPRLIVDRGLQMGATARYLGETAAGPYAGSTQFELLVHDRITKTDRWLLNSVHNQSLTKALTFGWNVRAASDNEYPSDFSQSIAGSAERQLLRELRTDYQSRYWSLSARAQSYQILQDPAAAANPAYTVARPYDRMPQINFHSGRYDVAGFDWSVDAEATRFWHPDLVRGNRVVALGQVSYPWIRPGYFITPKLMLNASQYQLDGSGLSSTSGSIGGQGALTTIVNDGSPLSRVLPTFSLDSGLVFERDSKLFGRAVTQTLEPRLFYVRTPYKDQSRFPNFDTAEAGFSFAQIFSENRFIGSDRISDANQVTAAVVSRFIESNGAERLRMAIGQRFYFSTQRVQLDPLATPNASHSDALVAVSGRVSDYWNFDSAVQYNASTRSLYSANYGVQWQPSPKRVINAEYRFQRDSFRNVDLSTQWPLSARWYGVGRVSYSLKDRKMLESLIGLEYKADCWVFRMGAQRFVTAAQTVSTPKFFQLQLNGLSKLGFGNPLESFYKNIPGYTRLNPEAGRQ
ncbi:MAG: LPS-assembly protein LptD [Massilia sp.]